MRTLVKEYLECTCPEEEMDDTEFIQSKIDFEHSIIIRYPVSSGMYTIYVIEFKTENQNHKILFGFDDDQAKYAFNNVYIDAILAPGAFKKIPVWECKINHRDLLDYRKLNCRTIGACEIFDSIFCARQRQKMVCPETGAFTAYKKVVGNDGKPYVCELLIPEDASRLSGFERKCRTNKAEVIAMWELEYVDEYCALHFRKTRKRVGHSIRCKQRNTKYAHTFGWKDLDFVYRVGKTVKPDNGFDTDRFNTCAPGIHFFMTMIEAYTYRF